MAIRALVSFVVLTAATIGCSSAWPRQEPQAFPAGQYTVQFTAAGVPPKVPERLRSMMTGTSIVTFTPDGRVRNEVNGKIDAEGHYASTAGSWSLQMSGVPATVNASARRASIAGL
jgi:hypothetical protein